MDGDSNVSNPICKESRKTLLRAKEIDEALFGAKFRDQLRYPILHQ